MPLKENQLLLSYIPISKEFTQNAKEISIFNPNLYVIRIFKDKTYDNLIAYALHWSRELFCFPLNRIVNGTYYASIGCLAPTLSTSTTAFPTSSASL